MKRLCDAAKKTAKKFPVEDIILFGSMAKGKEDPQDIDVLFVFKEHVDKRAEAFFKNILKERALDLTSMTRAELEGEGFIAKESMLLEGISLLDAKPLAQKHGLSSFALAKYDLTKTTGSKRTRFYYALHGRGGQVGALTHLGASRLAENSIICRYADVEELEAFFAVWDIPVFIIPMLIPQRLEHILLKS